MAGGAGKTGSASSGQADALSAIANNLMQSGGSFLNTLFAQGNEAARTGGIGAHIPIVQRAVESSRQAGSQAMTDARAGVSRAGMGRSTQGQSILAQLGLAGTQATEAIPTNYAQSLIQLLMGVAPQTTGQAVQATSASGQLANVGRGLNITAQAPWLNVAAGAGARLGEAGVTKGADWLGSLLSSGSTSPAISALPELTTEEVFSNMLTNAIAGV